MIELDRIKQRALKYGFSQKHWQCRRDIEVLVVVVETMISNLKANPNFYTRTYGLDNIKTLLRLAEKRTLGNKL